MQFWFSGEIDSEIHDQYTPIRKEVEAMLNAALRTEDYGPAVNKIAIIPMILGPRFAIGRKERRLVQRSSKSADYRTFIDFTAFRDGQKEQRLRLLVENVLAAVQDIDRKLKGKLDGSRLCRDIRSLFGVPSA